MCVHACVSMCVHACVPMCVVLAVFPCMCVCSGCAFLCVCSAGRVYLCACTRAYVVLTAFLCMDMVKHLTQDLSSLEWGGMRRGREQDPQPVPKGLSEHGSWEPVVWAA